LVAPTPAGCRTSDLQDLAAATQSVLLSLLNWDSEGLQQVKLQNWMSCVTLQGGAGVGTSGASPEEQGGLGRLWNTLIFVNWFRINVPGVPGQFGPKGVVGQSGEKGETLSHLLMSLLS